MKRYETNRDNCAPGKEEFIRLQTKKGGNAFCMANPTIVRK